MKINAIMETCRKLITPEIKRDVELSMFIADWVVDMLDTKGMTQRQFAAQLGKSESEISSWLCGTHVFTTRTIAKIETVLGEELIPTTRAKRPVVMNCNPVFCREFSPKKDNWLATSGGTAQGSFGRRSRMGACLC